MIIAENEIKEKYLEKARKNVFEQKPNGEYVSHLKGFKNIEEVANTMMEFDIVRNWIRGVLKNAKK